MPHQIQHKVEVGKPSTTHLVINSKVFVDALRVSSFEFLHLELCELAILGVVSANLPKKDSAQDQNN